MTIKPIETVTASDVSSYSAEELSFVNLKFCILILNNQVSPPPQKNGVMAHAHNLSL